jgi:hypothetical protein
MANPVRKGEGKRKRIIIMKERGRKYRFVRKDLLSMESWAGAKEALY